MDCIIDFLSDIKQKDLRRLAQNQSECYEDAIELYKELFISNFSQIKDACSDEKCDIKSKCNELREIILGIENAEIIDFFDKMKLVYINWIDAKIKDSLEVFTDIMNQYELWCFYDTDIKKEIFFKGRIEKNILTRWEMFHIPFNKRYLIKNQRYSLTGQPIIYLGKSIVDIIHELDISDENIGDLKISSIRIKEDLKVYDLRNNIYDLLNKTEFLEVIGGEGIEKNYKQTFFKILLASICSFERKKEHKDYTFCEEYVIPQILAQTLKNKEYDGIIYFSTKKFEGVSFENTKENISLTNKTKYKENVALFTNFNKDHVYDEVLYSKLDISSPIDLTKSQDFNINHLDETCKKIEFTKNQKEINDSQVIVTIFKREFEGIKINDSKYIDKDMGKMHIYHLYCILNKILCKSSEVVINERNNS
ncbi:hypothetical protein [Clostridium manihotivorum]|uniref:RES domain-containing protein n=1 Tax=Clostridium manihotivorum TaxID=2320868 RepID=A0A410DQG4_9CLOT|nr:hypothetical protein [Clostridium manihotivorum]QAA31334.1 hypothetical protein C1I91_06575 [Clostridium manihotivorum]